MIRIILFFKWIRAVNLLFILLTQYAFYHFLILPLCDKYQLDNPNLDQTNLLILMFASVCIAAGGNIINDYFDVNIDLINKPDRTYVGKVFSKRSAILVHQFFSILGLIASFYVAYSINSNIIFLGNFIAVLLLWVYSTSFKKKNLIGNLTISLLSSWVLLVLFFSELPLGLVFDNKKNMPSVHYWITLFFYTCIYAGFAFLSTLLREIIKDIEDVEGDLKNGCNTLPIKYGVHKALSVIRFVTILFIVMMMLLCSYFMLLQNFQLVIYLLLFVVIPIGIIFYMSAQYKSVKQMHRLSILVKWIMFTGICSIFLIKL